MTPDAYPSITEWDREEARNLRTASRRENASYYFTEQELADGLDR